MNDSVTVEELLKGIIIVSGNDACVALAEGIAGTEENFVEIMNEKAIKEHSSPLSGKNLPFSSLSEKLDDKKKKKDSE